MGSVIGEFTGANRAAARSAGKGALAQQREARRIFEMTKKFGEEGIARAESPQELQALEQSLASQERNLQSQEKLAGAIDPAILAAAENLTSILGGQESQAAAPLRRQRQRQREKLVNQLREQLGPGAETTSAGVQALQQFDLQSTDFLAQAELGQQGSLSNILSQQFQNRGSFGREISRLGDIGGAFGQRAARRSGAQFQAGQLVSGAGQQTVGTAGAGQVEGMARARQRQQFGSELFQGALTLGAGALAGGLGTKAGFSFDQLGSRLFDTKKKEP